MSSLLSAFTSQTDSLQIDPLPSASSPQEKISLEQKLIDLLSPLVEAIGYEIIQLEVQTHQNKTLRVFIDFLSSPSQKIGIEDCVQVSQVLDEKLDQLEEINEFLTGSYELEVSSPGMNRPLRKPKDFIRYSGSQIKIHLFRPLTLEEINNPAYLKKNPKQKNFKGTLVGLRDEKVILIVSSSHEKGSQKLKRSSKAQKKARPITNSEEGTVEIPLPLISKANLEPNFDFEASNERESKL